MRPAKSLLFKFLPFWLFLVCFKIGGSLHYSLLSPFGAHFLPFWLIGLVVGGASLAQLLLDVPAGYLLDRFGYLRLLKIGTVLFLLAGVNLLFAFSLQAYLLYAAIGVFGWQFFTPGVNAYMLTHAQLGESGRFFSLKDTFGSIGVVVASVVLPFVLLFSPSSIGIIFIVFFALAVMFLLFSPADSTAHVPHSRHYRARGQSFSTLTKTIRQLNPASSMLLMLTFSAAIFYAAIWFVIPLVIAQQQSNAGLLGIGLGIFDFAIVVLGYVLGTLADKGNKRTLVFFGLLIFAVCAALTGLSFGWLFILFGFLSTSGDEMASVSLWSWLHSLDKDHAQDGALSGTISLFEDFGWAIGPVAAGILYTFFGATWTIVLGAVPLFIVWLIYYIFVHEHFSTAYLYELAPHRLHKRRYKA